jgi:hypothetical protein
MRRTITIRPVAAIGLVLLIAGCASHPNHAPAATDLSSDIHTIDDADARATGMIDLVHLPAGAASATAPPPGLNTNKDIPTNGLPAVGVPRYWSVPGPPADVIDYVRSHPPAGLMLQNDTAPAELEFASKDKEGCLCNTIVVRVVPDGGHSAVRADVQVIWRRL